MKPRGAGDEAEANARCELGVVVGVKMGQSSQVEVRLGLVGGFRASSTSLSSSSSKRAGGGQPARSPDLLCCS